MPLPPRESSTTPIARSAADGRAWIVGELAKSLKVDASAINTNTSLYELGVDSLVAITMTGELAGWLNRDLPATLMWDYASIDAIAEALSGSTAPVPKALPPGVVDLQPLGRRRPVFFFPGMGGHPVTFAALATHLGPAQPCYGLTVPGLDGQEKPLACVEDVAAVMLRNIRLVQPRGPYQLAGYSFGGFLAYETAQQLTAAGETVSMLAIYDTFTPAGRVSRPIWQRLAIHVWIVLTEPGRVQYVRERLTNVRAILTGQNREGGTISPLDSPETNFRNVGAINKRAADNYQPRPYPHPVLVFRANDREVNTRFYKTDATNGWGPLTGGRAQVIDLAGQHIDMFNADRAPATAEALRPFLSD